MAEQRNHYPNTGVLFHNERKIKPSHPDYTGEGEFICPNCGRRGFLVWLSAWVKEASNGNKYLSMTFRLKDQVIRRPKKKPPAPKEF